jgi:hypothetical protein
VSPIIRQAVAEAGGWECIEAVAVTAGPGLIGALLVGLQAGKAIAYARSLPLIGVNHLAGHLLAPFLDRPLAIGTRPTFPFVALLASGGNYHGSEGVYGVTNPQLNYSAVMADLGARWFVLPYLHVTVHGGYTLFRRFEFSQSRRAVPGGKYDLANGAVYGVDLGFGG